MLIGAVYLFLILFTLQFLTLSSSSSSVFFFSFLDGGGGAYCIIEQDKAVEVPLPYYVQTVYGPCMQEVVHKYAYSSGLTQRTRIVINDPTVHVIHDGGRLPSDRELGESKLSSIIFFLCFHLSFSIKQVFVNIIFFIIIIIFVL